MKIVLNVSFVLNFYFTTIILEQLEMFLLLMDDVDVAFKEILGNVNDVLARVPSIAK